MIPRLLRPALLALALVGGDASGVLAQTPTPTTSTSTAARQKSFSSPEAAADALTEAIRKNDDRAVAAILGNGWREFVPGPRQDEDDQRTKFLAAWDDGAS